MARTLAPRGSVELADGAIDFRDGIVGDVSDVGGSIRHLKRANNAIFDPLRAIGVRRGTRDAHTGTFPAGCHSLMFYPSASGNRYFVGAGAKLYRLVEGGDPVEQVLPITPVNRKWSWCNLNGALIATQEGGATAPIAYNGTDWLSIALPAPVASLTFPGDTNTGGVVDAGAHTWRVRWRFRNGSSIAGPAVAHTVVAPNLTVNLATGFAASARSDYVGWTLERTLAGTTGPFYFVADGLPAALTYVDGASDASLLKSLIGAEPGVHAGPPLEGSKYFDGVVAYRNRLFGWIGAHLYVSRAIADPVEASGIYNFHPQSFYLCEDDGDPIMTCKHWGGGLAIVKGSRTIPFSGFDPLSFAMDDAVLIGTPSTRGVVAHAGALYVYGGNGKLFEISGKKADRIGERRVGHYFKEMSQSLVDEANVVLWNQEGDRLCMAYTRSGQSENGDILAHRFVEKIWEHYADLHVADAMVPPARTEFSGARLLFADPRAGLPATNAAAYALNPSFVSWIDARTAALPQTYVQSINSLGADVWTAGGVLIGTATVGTDSTECCSDGTSAFVAYSEDRGGGNGYGAFVQKLNAAGAKQWGASGLIVFNPPGDQKRVRVAAAGDGGCYVAWINEADESVRVQRITTGGAIHGSWPALGAVLHTPGVGPNHVGVPVLEGAFLYVPWWASDTGEPRVQKLNVADGSVAATWPANGVALGVEALSPYVPNLLLDGAGGVFMLHSSSSSSLKVKKVAAGAVVWTSAELAAALVVSPRFMAPDGVGGIVVSWSSGVGVARRPCVHRVDGSGNAAWASRVVLNATSNLQTVFGSVPDGAGGVVVSWLGGGDIYAERIAVTGAVHWGSGGGVKLRDGVSGSVTVATSCSDGNGGAILTWEDPRGANVDLYAQRVSGAGVALWTANGVAFAAGADAQSAPRPAFFGTPVGQYPPSLAPGGHIWIGFDGTRDERAYDTSGGSPISWLAEMPEYDGGQPDTEKDYGRVVFFVLAGGGSFNATLVLDTGIAVAINLGFEHVGSKWGRTSEPPGPDTLIWNVGRWASRARTSQAIAPLPLGTQGTKYRLTLAAQLEDDVVIAGYLVDEIRLPDRPISVGV